MRASHPLDSGTLESFLPKGCATPRKMPSSELRHLVESRAEQATRVGGIRRGHCVPLTFFSLLTLGTIVAISFYDRAESGVPQEPPADPNDARAPEALPVCGDGRCDYDYFTSPETMETCMADCPGVTTPAECGEEPHSDPGGHAVTWGASHIKETAAQCCEACAAHARDPRHRKKPCNSWAFCHARPYCWSLDTGNFHSYGECWLKHQSDPEHPLYGQRGKFTAEFRLKHANAHKTGRMPNGAPRNLSVPTHVPWTGGVMHRKVDLSVKWETGLNGMRSSTGETEVLWRAWESKEQNLARGVKPESMPK